ncbi:Rhizobactin receptor [Aureimonas ureilytica]|uniref:Rhizobactin receptor n=1 Tax=Aureimonas ureilytica TaxID=401562 RepID=A0A175RTW8_9HYPH|nr:TonB-dependent receptor [Aureimonas ureilytica]KTR06272.1 Rhizobactin receptor [Aureimonas ureilytica]
MPLLSARRRALRRSISLVALGCALTLSFSATAQETVAGAAEQTAPAAVGTGDASVLLDPIVVTGSRAPQRLSETARTVYVVEGREIEARVRSGQTLQQALGQDVPSYDAASSGARTSYGQNLRGRPALVLIDGVSLNSARGLYRQFDSIDPFNIARVEILSGATSLYGGNATGGIINIITKKGRDAKPGLGGEAMVGAESGFRGSRDGDGKLAGALTYNDDLWDARLSIAGNKTRAFYDGSGTILVPDITQTSLAFNERVDLFGTAGLQIDESRRAEISAQHYRSEQDSDYGLFFGTNFAALRNPRLFETRQGYQSDVQPATRRTGVNGSYTDSDFLGQELLVQAFWRTESIDFHPFPVTVPLFYFNATEQDTNFYGFKAAMVSKPLEGLRITYGIDGDRDEFSSSQAVFDSRIAARSGALDMRRVGELGLYPAIDVSTIAGFAEASYEATDALTLTGGVRYQYVDTKVGDFVAAAAQVNNFFGRGTSADTIPSGSVSYDDLLFNAGATYRFDDRSQVYANFSQGFELPDPSRYYGLGTYSLVGNRQVLRSSVNVADSALQSIKTNAYEVGYRYADGILSAEAAAYYSLSDRTIQLNRQTLNISLLDQDRRAYGVEGRLGLQLGHGFDAGVLGNLVQTEVDQNGDWRRASVGDASTSKLGGHIGWTDDITSVRLEGQHVFSLSDTAGFEIKGYTLFDLMGSHRFETADTTLNFGIQNLFDKDYTTIWGQRAVALYGSLADKSVFDYKGRGRTFAISLSKEF